MKNVILISHCPPPVTGIGSWTKRLLNSEYTKKCNVFFVNSNTIGGRDPFKNPKRSIRNEFLRSKNIYKKEKNFLKNNKIDIVHTNIPCTFFGTLREIITGKIAKKYKAKFILHCRCTVPNVVNKKIHIFFFKKLLSICDGVIVLNTRSLNFIKSLNDKVKCEVIPNFVDDSEIVDKKEINEKVENVVYTGGVIEEKGCKLIVELAKSYPNIKFNLIGNIGEDMINYPKTNNVIFHGVQNKEYLYEYLKKSDVFFFLSKYWGEGFSNSLTEAMGMGMPCIVTKWAANDDMIDDNKGGYCIDIDDYEMLKARFIDIMDENTRKEFSNYNVNKTKSFYSINQILRQLLDFYNQI